MPKDDETPIHVSIDKARAGSTPGVVRWMLAISLIAVMFGMLLIWLLGGKGH